MPLMFRRHSKQFNYIQYVVLHSCDEWTLWSTEAFNYQKLEIKYLI